MANRDNSYVSAFHPLVWQWFSSRFGKPTGVQRAVWPLAAAGRNLLATAPTGSGKTLAAFLWAIDQLGTSAWEGGTVRVVYISPLRALNNDVRRNLLDPLRELQALFLKEGKPFAPVNVVTRSGDTDAGERRRMLSRPPEILVTTPESLNLLVTSQGGRRILTGVRTVILDEIHAIAADKRGTFLMTAIERLALLSGDFQRIALSATVEPLDTIARFVAGYRLDPATEKNEDGAATPRVAVPRPIEIVRSRDRKRITVDVVGLPKSDPAQQSFWPAVAQEIAHEISPDHSTLVFVNNRRLSERLCHLLNETAGHSVAYSHHGAMAREVRALVEKRLKSGELSALVATGSLELGIDVGSVEKVLLVQTPRTLNGAIQRVGRAGHGVGQVSVARIFPSHSGDLLDAAVFAPLVRDQRTQPIRPVRNALDVLAQVLVAMCGVEPWQVDDLFAFITTCDAYHTLARKAFDLVIQMLEGRYFDARIGTLRPRLTRDDEGRLIARDGALSLVFTSGGVIPDRGYFNVRIRGTKAVLGQLDEEFVWERRVGDQFRIGMQSWRIEKITHNDVEVGPGSSVSAGMPFWRGESEDRHFSECEKIATFLETADADLAAGEDRTLHRRLMAEHCLTEAAADDLVSYLHRQRGASGASLPHRHHVLVEHAVEAGVPGGGAHVMIIHARWGGSVLRPWAIALAAAWQRKYGTTLQVFSDDDCMLLQLPGEVSADEALSLVAPEDVDALLRDRLESTGFFGARFRENAGRALLLPRNVRRRMPLWLNRLRAKKLFQQVGRFSDFPIIAETWRECLQDDFECDMLRAMLAELQDRRIRISEVRTPTPSPFAAAMVWLSTNQHVYEGDETNSGGGSTLSTQTLREVVFDAALRPRIPIKLISELTAKLQRILPGYAPATADELIDLVNERLVVPQGQWESLRDAVVRDQPEEAGSILRDACGRLLGVRLPGAAERLVIAEERLPRVLRSVGVALEACEVLSCDSGVLDAARAIRVTQLAGASHANLDDDDSLLSESLASILAFHGPLLPVALRDWLGLSEARLVAASQPLVEAGRIVIDLVSEDATTPQWCDADNLERLLRLLRISHRQVSFTMRSASELPLLWAGLQGATVRGVSEADLQHRLEKLFGYPAPAGLWETAILPARISQYVPAVLDSFLQSSRLGWYGTGQPAQTVFCFQEDLDLFPAAPEGAEEDPEPSPIAQLLPDGGAGYDFDAIRRQLPTHSSGEVTRLLWKAAWHRDVTADSFAPLRKAAESGFDPEPEMAMPPAPMRSPGDFLPRAGSARPRGRGRDWRSRELPGVWRRVENDRERPEFDRLQSLEADKDRVRQLLDRYGVIFRELLTRELPALRWAKLLPALRLLELSGEVIAGAFFEGINGLQFASPEAIQRLTREGDEKSEERPIYWLNAADPASPCGLGLEALADLNLPSRQASNWLIYHDSKLVIVVRRQGLDLDIRCEPDDTNLILYLDFFRSQITRAAQPQRRVVVETINGSGAPSTPYAAAFRAAGFDADYKSLILYRQF